MPSGARSMLMRFGLCALALTIVSCAESEESLNAYPVIFQAHEPSGKPVSGVGITVNARSAGRTDAEGSLRVSLKGREGGQAKLQADCPEGYLDPIDLQPIVLRKVLKVAVRPDPQAIEIAVTCKPAKTKAVVVVRADGEEDMPVLVDGSEVARTNSEGVAHLIVNMAPGTEFQVKLSTTHKPRLRPQEPSQTFAMQDIENVLVFDQKFEMAESKRRSRRSRRSSKSKPGAPVRLN